MKNAMRKSLGMNLTIVKATLIFEAAILILGVSIALIGVIFSTNLVAVGIVYDVILIMAGFVWFFAVGIVLFGSELKNSIQMNQSRKQSILGANVIYLGLMLLFALVMFVIQLIYLAFGALDFKWLISGIVLALAIVGILGVLSIGMLGGALLFRYGKIGLWILYGTFIFIIIVASQLSNIRGSVGDLILAFLSIPWQGQMLIGVAVSGIFWIVGYGLMKRVNI